MSAGYLSTDQMAKLAIIATKEERATRIKNLLNALDVADESIHAATVASMEKYMEAQAAAATQKAKVDRAKALVSSLEGITVEAAVTTKVPALQELLSLGVQIGVFKDGAGLMLKYSNMPQPLGLSKGATASTADAPAPKPRASWAYFFDGVEIPNLAACLRANFPESKAIKVHDNPAAHGYSPDTKVGAWDCLQKYDPTISVRFTRVPKVNA